MATRWAICGTGKIAHDFCTCLNFLPDDEHQISAVASHSSKSKADAFAHHFGIPQTYGTYDEMLQHEDIDIVYVAVINPLHVETCLKVINAGKAVLCEKPMAMTLEGCKKVIAAVKEKGVFFMEAFVGRCLPAMDFIRQELEAGNHLGNVKTMEASVCLPLMDVPRVKNKALGGGGLLDIGCYAVQAANIVFGGQEPEMGCLDGFWTTDPEDGVDKSAVVVLRYSGDRIAILHYSIETLGGNNTMVIRGDKGTIEVPDKFWIPEKVIVNGQVHEFPLPDLKHEFNFRSHQGMIYEAKCVRDCLMNGLKECPRMTHADSESIMVIMQGILDNFGITYGAP